MQIEQQPALFRERFGPAVLRDLDGEALLRLMHGRLTGETRCLAYWLEFKNYDEFSEPDRKHIRNGYRAAPHLLVC